MSRLLVACLVACLLFCVPAAAAPPDAASARVSLAAHALDYGMLLALGLYSLLLWFSLRDCSDLAYVAFVAAMAIGQLAQGGLGYLHSLLPRRVDAAAGRHGDHGAAHDGAPRSAHRADQP